jgi:hypothetical protein
MNKKTCLDYEAMYSIKGEFLSTLQCGKNYYGTNGWEVFKCSKCRINDIELKTSGEWQRVCKITVIDPDGWDRKDFQYSWYEEKITREEFEKRIIDSTCQFPKSAFKKDYNMWKDKE